MMRVEARPEDRAEWESGPAAVPIASPAPAAASGPIGFVTGSSEGLRSATGAPPSAPAGPGVNKGIASPQTRGPRQSGAFKIPPAAYPRSPGSLSAAVLSNGAPKVPAPATTPAPAAPSLTNASVQLARSSADSGAVPVAAATPNAPLAAATAADEPAVSAGLPSGRVLLVIVALIAAAIVVFIVTK